jgi:ring-1,2-phenylacetyl-CoA epoxidase subunit PaaD
VVTTTVERAWRELERIADPEIPAISLVDLGVIGDVRETDDALVVELLPTFVGCPAIDVMRQQIGERLGALDLASRVDVRITFNPPWTSERISERGRARLRASGFAPPVTTRSESAQSAPRSSAPGSSVPGSLEELAILPIAECPYCGSRDTTLENAFGPTLCRAIYHCAKCRQPFEQFKRI